MDSGCDEQDSGGFGVVERVELGSPADAGGGSTEQEEGDVAAQVRGQLEQEAEILTSQRVDPPSVYGYSHREVIRDFAQAVREGRAPGTPGEEARKSLALVLAIYEAAATGREVMVIGK